MRLAVTLDVSLPLRSIYPEDHALGPARTLPKVCFSFNSSLIAPRLMVALYVKSIRSPLRA